MKKNLYEFCDKTQKEIYLRLNAIKTDAIICAIVALWVWALCKLFSFLVPVDELVFKKFFVVFFCLFCVLPFLALVIKNLFILFYYKIKYKYNKKASRK